MDAVHRRSSGRAAGVHDHRGGRLTELPSLFRPQGHALGIVVCGEAGEELRETCSALLREHGQEPGRRLCILRPRSGEEQLRTEDAVYFLDRFGHEYALALLPSGDDEVFAAARRGGVAAVAFL